MADGGRAALPIGLGTVQLGMPYGRRRGAPLMAREQAYAILDHAWSLGVRVYDTAESYGEAAVRLAEWIKRHGHAADVVTKVADGADVADRAAQALARFGAAHWRTLLSHNAVTPASWDRLRAAADAAGAAAGQSVYGADEVAAAVAAPGAARVQAPANVFDTAALRARGGHGVPLDLRSVYLQGVLLEDPAAADARAPGTGALASAVRRAASEVGEPAGPLLVAVMLRQLRPGDRLVLGADEPAQLDVIPAALALAPGTVHAFRSAALAAAGTIAAGVMDPRRWR